jgi:hypothetical protein
VTPPALGRPPEDTESGDEDADQGEQEVAEVATKRTSAATPSRPPVMATTAVTRRLEETVLTIRRA